MISKISIQNFKSLKDVKLDCANLTLLTGLNGVGKSSLIQVLLLLRQSNDKGYLKEIGLTLKGDLINIGVGKDALYQKADKEEISFAIDFLNGKEHVNHLWTFGYEENEIKGEYKFSDSDVLPFAEDIHKPENLDSLPFFNSQFKYLNAERWVKNQYERSDTQVVRNRNIGKHGEFATHYLAHFGPKKEAEIDDKLLYPKPPKKDQSVNKTLEYQVSAWMNDISPGVIVKAEKILGVDAVRLGYEFESVDGNTDEIMPTNVGFGITYVLPVVVALLSAKPGDILVIENPESHVHPKGQSSIGKLIALVASLGVQIVIETHSDHIINGVLITCKKNEAGESGIDKDLVKIYYFTREDITHSSKIDEIKVLNDGKIDKQPAGFFDQTENDLSYLLGF